MPRQNKRRTKRVKNLIVVSTLSAVLLSISTYAWFIGLRSVNVSSFDVEIASTDSLSLSLDGETWSDSVEINKENFMDAYTGNTNSWGGEGLKPMSTIGDMDSAASRMKIFEKASLTATPGGYRIMASRVNNFDSNPEQDGYVAFDLFIRNNTGSQYIKELNILDEESIYLTVDSEVTVSDQGGVKDTGIENSVRVAFAQIGRVPITTLEGEKVQGITCSDDELNDVTGICRTAQIWEPNDTSHVLNAIKHYNKSCKKRIAADLTLKASYEGDCNGLTDGLAYPTYAMNQPITSANRVDIYDGPAYNLYEDSEEYLTPYPYFTDTQKFLAGTERPEFMSLAPASITKVRIYIYLEGQDIDNYDFAQIGKKISIKFGFSKNRFTEDDIDYNGPHVNQQQGPNGEDLTPPRMTLNGEQRVEITKGDEYTELGATAEDNIDGEIAEVIPHGHVNTDVVGTYYITYKAVDAAGNLGTIVRTIVVTE